MLAGGKESGKSPSSGSILNKPDFVTRDPISIFSRVKNASDKEEKKKLNQLLEILRMKLPEGFKIGAAVGEEDCFFDSIAQGLDELKDKGLIAGSKGFSVKSLRENCKQYAQQVNQSKKGSWLSSALKGEGEKLCEYIPRIEFTAEDIDNTCSGSRTKIQKLENAIWGRPEVEGKMICEKYGVKVRTIELRDKEIDGLDVIKSKVGTGNNVIYIVNYKNHFVPLLSNIKKDIKRSIKVSREEAYGNVIGSSSKNISQSFISTPLQHIENPTYSQSDCSRSPGKENHKTGRKRGRSVTDKDNKAPKRARMDVNVVSNEDLESCSDLQDRPEQDELLNAKRHIPHHLIELMYQLDLSVLCLLRKSTYEHKYPLLSVAFGDDEIDKFSNIVLRYKEKSIHIQVQNLDNYIDSNISYTRLFNKERRSASINSYFDSFVKHLISKSDSLYNVKYLIVYTNSGLDLTEEKELKQGRSKNYYPFKFCSINVEENDILKNFLFTSNDIQGHGFYQFSQDKTTREELLKRLEFSPAVQRVIKKREFSQGFEKEIKEAFLDKLVFAVNQPNREELNNIIRSEMKRNNEVHDNYITLQETILSNLEEHKKLGNYISGIIYEFNLLMLFLHDMFLNKNIFSINFEGENLDTPNNITINYKGRPTYLEAHNADSNIDYSQLFPSKQQNNTFSLDRLFTLFVENLGESIEYFIIYTNAVLDLTEEMELKPGQSKDFYPLKFDIMNMRKKKFKILKDYSCIGGNDLYQFSQEEKTRKKLLGLLKLPPSLQNVNEKETKEKFLDTLVFVVNQSNREELNSVIRDKINNQSNIPYNCDELHEIALRWLESHEFGPVRKEIIEKLLEDIKNKRSSYQEIQNKDINEEFKFAKSVVGREGTSVFYQFLGFLVKGEGKKCLEVLKREGINLSTVSSILHGAGDSAVKAFRDLYDFWFDGKGNKTQHLTTLEEGINLSNISSILHGARANAAKAFKDLYDLWFDSNGKKTKYLIKLEENGVDLVRVSSILSGAGTSAAKAFKDLYNLWFDKKGNRTQYLKILEEEGINLSNISSILGGAGTNASKAFKDLYDLWFDEQGNKKQHLKTLEQEGINLSNMSSILHRAGAKAAKAFKDLYGLWFDEQGNKKQYLKTLEKEGINLSNVSNILGGSGANAAKAFKDLYDLWFDKQGNKKQCLEALKENGINLSNMSSILSGAGSSAARAFKDLYDFFFDKQGNKKQCLNALEKRGMNLSNMSSILSGAGSSAAKAFKDLYDFWFDKQGNKTQYLKTLEEKGINLFTVSSILHGAGTSAAKAFKDLYNLWFDKKGNKTQYLKTLEKEGINLSNINSILGGAGSNAPKAFKDLCDLWFDEEGNEKQYLKHFIEKRDEEKTFTMYNLSSILGGAGASAKYAFEKFHSVCFDKEGKRTQLLDDFYEAGFEPSNISCMLCKAAVHTSSIFKRLHSVCFNNDGNRTKLLDDFYKAGFRPCDLCSILSGAADCIEKFHDFCFVGETKKYLNHFLNDKKGFTLINLCNIMHGVRANICSALKDFHDVCFDEVGNKTQLLADFRKVGFKYSYLSNILSMSGNNATSILKSFHKVYFYKENHLNHFLAEKELFTPKGLSKILHGIGLNICPTLEKLYDLCFNKAGNKTEYLSNLIKNNQHEMFNILYKKVRKASFAFLDEQSISEDDEITNVGLESSNSSGRTEQGLNLGNAQQNDHKVKRKTRKQL
ncbi:uncharacterized protein LOC119669277 [Teleopsis dalmanni]|uniref:uncharacterized protein LOC119669277 n=1 Tax=Teleopsis dalmanni TaxID=139649 RepID=UPI0018CFE7F7|nr:uncharacterized protein LOC119669277 [Teleopsis dalmanni]XP_037935034.1 uncharacterized protein LOC119669277 [Teleopsis dalmanni]